MGRPLFGLLGMGPAFLPLALMEDGEDDETDTQPVEAAKSDAAATEDMPDILRPARAALAKVRS